MFEKFFGGEEKEHDSKEAVSALEKRALEIAEEIKNLEESKKSILQMQEEILHIKEKRKELKEEIDNIADFEMNKLMYDSVNFETNLEEKNDGSFEITLKRDDGEVFNINSLLPNKYCKLIASKDDEFVFTSESPEENYVQFPSNSIDTRSFLLNLLHEIGHAHQEADPDWKGYKLREVWEYSDELNKEYLKKIKDEENKLGEVVDNLEIVEEEIERNAWSYAVNKLREIEKSGYDVFNGYGEEDSDGSIKGRNKEMWAHIKYCLWTYKNAYTNKLMDKGVILNRNEDEFNRKKKLSNSLRNPK